MATATLGPQGKVRALGSVRDQGYNMRFLQMNTFPISSTTPDPAMVRTLTWGTHADYARTTNALPVKTTGEYSEFGEALLFPIAGSRKFSNMTLHLADSNTPLLLTFVLEGAESSTVSSYGTAKLVGSITIRF